MPLRQLLTLLPMKLKQIIFAGLISCFAVGFSSCSKVSNAVPPAPTANLFLKGADGPPLWLVDNVEVIMPYAKGNGHVMPNANDIQNITVLSPATNIDLVTRYGTKGKNGVVLVTTKKAVR